MYKEMQMTCQKVCEQSRESLIPIVSCKFVARTPRL